MRIKSLIILSFLVIVSACKKTQEETTDSQTEQDKSKEITEIDVSNLKYVEYILDSKTEDIVKDWAEYIQLEGLVNGIKTGDLVFFKDNSKAIQLLLKDLKQNIPKTLNSESILSRILVLETKTYKLESLANLSTTSKAELLGNIKEFFISFSNLNFQMNKKTEFDTRDIKKP